ncbi:MAG: NAD(P)H-dependent glycerol-3-phosphate dehydrogenase [Pseudomonadota bacterium]
MIAILGAGAFGTALAVALADRGVTLWGRGVEAWSGSRENPRLPGVMVPETVSIVGDLAATRGAEAVLLCLPMQQLGPFLAANAGAWTASIVACCKGIDLNTGEDAAQIVARFSDRAPSLLTGPSFAADIARLLPTALTLACADATLRAELQALLSTPQLRLYAGADVRGAALGGALKNVIAIACGAAMGAGLGPSARAAIMTRGFAEMTRFAVQRGAQPETLAGLSGFGDLALTCTSEASRNYRLGLALGAGEPFDPAITVEGAATAKALAGAPDMPITQTVAALVEGRITTEDAAKALMARPLKEE